MTRPPRLATRIPTPLALAAAYALIALIVAALWSNLP
jgi:hypothetical protein